MSDMLYGQLGTSEDFFYGELSSLPTSSVQLISCGTDFTVTSTQTAVAYTGLNLGATTGDRTLTIVQGEVEIEQTQQTGDSDSGTFDVVFTRAGTDLKYGPAILRATVGAISGSISITIEPPAGSAYVNIATPVTADYRITASDGDLAAGDQLEISGVDGGNITDVNVNDDGTFDTAPSVISFEARLWSTADKTWGDPGQQSLQDVSVLGPTGSAPKARPRWFNYTKSYF